MALIQSRNRKTKNLKVNIVFNALYQVLILIIPFITSPYISRVLLPSGVGNYSYAYSWIFYFIPIADYGFLEYGTVRIAKYRQDKEKYSNFFWQLFLCKFLLGLFVTGIYLVLSLSGVFLSSQYSRNTKIVFLIRSLDILASAFDVTFLFQGLEKFVSLCVRNLFVKVLNLVLIFCFVRTPADYMNYVIVISIGLFLTGASTLLTIPFSVNKPKFIRFNPLIYFKDAFVYFIPYFVNSAFYVIPKTAIGLVAKDSAVSGFYESADKLVNIVLTVIGSLSTIRRSRRTYLYETKNKAEIDRKVNQVFQLYALFALPCFFGLVSINKYFTLGFFGADYSASIRMIYIRAAKIIFNPLTKMIGSVYYVPTGHVWTRSFLLIAGLAFDAVACFTGTFLFGVTGTCVASRLAEAFDAILFIAFSKKYRRLDNYANDFRKSFDASLIRGLVLTICGSVLYSFLHQPTSSKKLIFISAILIVIGVVVYAVLVCFFKEELFISRYNQYKGKFKRWLKCRKEQNDVH